MTDKTVLHGVSEGVGAGTSPAGATPSAVEDWVKVQVPFPDIVKDGRPHSVSGRYQGGVWTWSVDTG